MTLSLPATAAYLPVGRLGEPVPEEKLDCPPNRRCARQSFRWYEWDPSFYALWILSKVGIVRGLKTPTPEILATDLVRAGHFDIGMFRTRWHVATQRLARFGVQAADSLAERRELLEARIDAARHDLDEHVQAKRLAFEELAAVRRSARLLQPVVVPSGRTR